MERCDFLPVSAEEMHERGWWWYDALVVGGDAYVDHPSFGTAVISRVLEAEGLRVAVLAQPDWHDAEAFRAMGRPRLGVFIGAGNLDSMVAHYTAAKRRRSEDFYSHGKRIFKMTPIHHHFELCGWKEEKIDFVFTAITLVMCVLAYLGVMNRY